MYTKLFSKPPMSEKLLSRPPFKYLFDVVVALIKTTQFADGLYTEAELDAAIYTNKEPKMKFLQKIIDCVQLVNGTQIDAKPSKIVAGQEPEKTNEWLQAMYVAATSKKDYKAAVKKILAAEGGAAAPAPEPKKEPPKEEHKEKPAKPKEPAREVPKEQPKQAKEQPKPQPENPPPAPKAPAQEEPPKKPKQPAPEEKPKKKPKQEEAPAPELARAKNPPGTKFPWK